MVKIVVLVYVIASWLMMGEASYSNDGFCCAQKEGTIQCKLVTDEELRNLSGWSATTQTYCRGLMYGMTKPQSCNFDNDISCLTACKGPRCIRTTSPCRGKTYIIRSTNQCWRNSWASYLQQICGNCEGARFKQINDHICEGLPENELIEHPCQNEVDIVRVDEADCQQKICAYDPQTNSIREYASEKDMHMTNCRRSCRIVECPSSCGCEDAQMPSN